MSNSICEIVELKNNKKIGQLVMDKSRYVIAKCKDTIPNKSEYMTINNNNNYNYIPSQQNLQVIKFIEINSLIKDIEEISILDEYVNIKYSIIYKKTILFVLNDDDEYSIYYILYRDDEGKILIIEKNFSKFNTYLKKSSRDINIRDYICIGELDHENYYKYKEHINKNEFIEKYLKLCKECNKKTDYHTPQSNPKKLKDTVLKNLINQNNEYINIMGYINNIQKFKKEYNNRLIKLISDLDINITTNKEAAFGKRIRSLLNLNNNINIEYLKKTKPNLTDVYLEKILPKIKYLQTKY